MIDADCVISLEAEAAALAREVRQLQAECARLMRQWLTLMITNTTAPQPMV